ncbi:MAG: LacI family transcriptional regulator [Candidatus Pacebacteria bacterium]|nr:LacI family transcriptional regulator [Candidatus Paceibacterota bacterium]
MIKRQRTKKLPKYLHVSETIRERIRNQTWKPGEQLPPARVFAEEFDVTPVTVWKALDELDREKLTYRVQGKGTFVTEHGRHSPPGLIGVIMQTEGHCYGTIFHRLVHAIAERHGHTAAGSIGPEKGCPQTDRERYLEQFLVRDLDALIVDGRTITPFRTLARNWPNGRDLTFLHRFESREHFPDANLVLTDWEVGGESAARHVLDQGCDRLAFFTFGKPGVDESGMGSRRQYHWQVRYGIERAIAAYGGDPERDLRIVVDAPGTDTGAVLRKALADGFRGVVCISDHRALKVYREAQAVQLNIGRDVLVTGFFDTPWASSLHPMLTSVSVQESRLAEVAAECVAEGWHGHHIKVPPVLVVRESTGMTSNEELAEREREVV